MLLVHEIWHLLVKYSIHLIKFILNKYIMYSKNTRIISKYCDLIISVSLHLQYILLLIDMDEQTDGWIN